ncbi:hypothetical protein Tco_1326299 [Tanacetum coccineum]
MSTNATHNAIMEAGGKDRAPMLVATTTETSRAQPTRHELETYLTMGEEKKKLIDVEDEAGENINKQDQNEVNEIQAERLARNANPLALIAATQ